MIMMQDLNLVSEQLSAVCGLADDLLTVDIDRAIDLISLSSRFQLFMK